MTLTRLSFDALGATILVMALVGVGWSIPAGHSKYFIALTALAIIVTLAVRQRGALIGLLVLGALNGIPFFDTNRMVASHITYQDVVTAVLVVVAFVWAVADRRVAEPTPTARTVSWCGVALVLWFLLTVVRSDARFLSAAQFGSDFLAFGAGLAVLPRVNLRRREFRAVIAVLGVGVVAFSIGQIMVVEGGIQLNWLVHATATSTTLGLTRVYAGMNDMLTCGVAFGIAYVALAQNRRHQVLAFLVTALLTTSLIVQLTRARWITLGLSIILVSLWLALQGHRRVAPTLRRRLALLFGATTTAVTAILIVAPSAFSSGAVVQRFISIFSDVGSSNTATSNVAVRQHVASAMLAVLGGKWPIGVGLIPPTTRYYPTLPLGSLRDVDLGVFNAIMTIGVIGAILIYIPVVIVLLRTMRAARAQMVEVPWLNYGGQIWIVATLTSSLTLVTLFSKSGVVLSAMVLAVLCQPSVIGAVGPRRGARGSPLWLRGDRPGHPSQRSSTEAYTAATR